MSEPTCLSSNLPDGGVLSKPSESYPVTLTKHGTAGASPGLLTDMVIFLYMCCVVRLMEEDIVGLEKGNEEERKAPIISWIPPTL